MEIEVHQIKMEFQVTPEIKRYVFMYLLVGEHCYLIDSGVAGADLEVEKYLHNLGRRISDVKAVFLTHAHPDHIGGAAKIKEKSGCKVYASQGESDWIEHIEKQFEERPIPNFYSLVNQSVKLDGILRDGDIRKLEPEITLKVIGTPGHSCDELSYMLMENHCIFTGDTIPVQGDIPIWINEQDSIDSLKRLAAIENVEQFYPAWDKTYEKEQAMQKIKEALNLIHKIKEKVKKSREQSADLEEITKLVCEQMNTPEFLQNPLFRRTIASYFDKD